MVVPGCGKASSWIQIGSHTFCLQANLPDELFGQEVAIEGHLDKILPVSGKL